MRNIFINGNGRRIGVREINVNIGKNKSNMRIDVLEINRKGNILVGYEIKSCIQDFRTDKKWRNYLSIINQLYFVFDSSTYDKHKNEIMQSVGNDAGIYVYNEKTRFLRFEHGGKFFTNEEKGADFYRIILFNYLLRNAINYFNRGEND